MKKNLELSIVNKFPQNDMLASHTRKIFQEKITQDLFNRS